MASELAKKAIAGNAAVVFSKSYCPFCRMVKQLLDSVGAKYKLFELDQMEDGSEIQSYVASKHGQRTVPAVFVGGQLIGGNDDTQAAHREGKLVPALKSAGAL
eukprot:TRINITY_DN1995_c1_g3_i2.p2 TRINITY_DN1995_c1_g3~~TRINITY_DN1995_c1_g3_i2.p2  ORF type:complete len:103 (-),score=32.27 TRINITY_DN1995_c1_g3_i2:236-544(-)